MEDAQEKAAEAIEEATGVGKWKNYEIGVKNMRDTIMNEQYFLEYIQEETERINKFTSKLARNEVREDRIYAVKEEIEGNYSFGFPHDKLTDIVADKENCVDKLKEYLEKYWYVGHKDMVWYDIHKAKEKLYYGYWSFEAGAIAKILNLDDSSLKDVPYYPYDLVHYKK